MNKRQKLLSVIVSTYNRAGLLEKCLNSLNRQDARKQFFEIIVVDNNSTDRTTEIIKRQSRNIRYFVEKNQGLSYSRNRGLKEARGKYIAYIDDDAIAYNTWVKNILEFIKKHPKVAVFGGPYYGYTLKEKPDWFPPEFGSFSLGDKVKKISTPKESLSGSNVVFKRGILEKFGGFDTKLGMKGDKLSYGEETKLIYKIDDAGYEVYYSPKIKVKHLITEYKLSLGWLLRNRFKRGMLWTTIHDREFSFFQHLRRITRSLKNLQKLTYGDLGPFKRRVYYALAPTMSNTGSFFNYIKENISL